ncbi:CU044_2847 family protein [Streptomyces sp. 2A115]|uniref:CU044_2847 family protein n=1 Tax=Streptomyces sp. 2A115 TaxID=3457439 RepID=UPI003FD11EDE
MERKIQEIELPGGEKVLARVSVIAPEEMPGSEGDFAYEDVGATEHMAARVDQLNELVRGVGGAVLGAARAVRPDEVSATFGVELVLKPGKAVALLADGEAKASLSVTLTWRGDSGASADGTGGTSGTENADGTVRADSATSASSAVTEAGIASVPAVILGGQDPAPA